MDVAASGDRSMQNLWAGIAGVGGLAGTVGWCSASTPATGSAATRTRPARWSWTWGSAGRCRSVGWWSSRRHCSALAAPRAPRTGHASARTPTSTCAWVVASGTTRATRSPTPASTSSRTLSSTAPTPACRSREASTGPWAPGTSASALPTSSPVGTSAGCRSECGPPRAPWPTYREAVADTGSRPRASATVCCSGCTWVGAREWTARSGPAPRRTSPWAG